MEYLTYFEFFTYQNQKSNISIKELGYLMEHLGINIKLPICID